MNTDQIEVKVKEVKSKIREVTDEMLDDLPMEVEGEVEKNIVRRKQVLVTSRTILKITRTRRSLNCSCI
jgi:predicted AAA+ superfamily ATPase